MTQDELIFNTYGTVVTELKELHPKAHAISPLAGAFLKSYAKIALYVLNTGVSHFT